MVRKLSVLLVMAGILLAGCGSPKPPTEKNFPGMAWEDIVKEARGTTVNFYMWGGDERINRWVDTYVAPRMKEAYGITVNRVPMDAAEFINKLLGEKQVNKTTGSIDLLWINGENFRTARQAGLLWGPFADKLPNYQKYIDKTAPDVAYDFGYPVEGYEVPYGKAQFVFTYNAAKVKEPPRSAQELLAWCKANPGKFTYPELPDFTGSVFVRHIMYELAGGYQAFPADTSPEELKRKLAPVWEYLNELKPYLWRKGETYPPDIATLDKLYADGEVYFTMNYLPTRTSGLVEQGIFPRESRTFVWDRGTIGNTHFLAIPFNAPNKAGAMALANFLESPEVQLSKRDPLLWGDLLALDVNKLAPADRERLARIPLGVATLPEQELQAHRVPEISAAFIPVIEDEWRKHVARSGVR